MGSPGRLQLGCSCVDPVPGQLTEHCQPPLPASLLCSWPHWGTDPGWGGKRCTPHACGGSVQALAPALRLANCSLLMARLAHTQMGAH